MNLIIIQARMGSTRLPGKVLMKIGEHTLLDLLLLRIKASKYADKIIVATTSNKEDDVLEHYCITNNIPYYRGSDWDVLDRFFCVASKENADTIIRITADCPLHHSDVIDFVVEKYYSDHYDYFSNSNHEPLYLEDGFDVEVFSYKALSAAHASATMLSEREHVTPYIKKSGLFHCGWEKYCENYNFKLSVDTIDDFNAVREIFSSFDYLQFTMHDVIELIKKKPEILRINYKSEINSGYKKSLANDKKIDSDDNKF